MCDRCDRCSLKNGHNEEKEKLKKDGYDKKKYVKCVSHCLCRDWGNSMFVQ